MAEFPLALINRILEPEGLIIHATKVRKAKQALACLSAHGEVERDGLFDLRRMEEDVEDTR